MTPTLRAWLVGALALAGFLPSSLAASGGETPDLTLSLNVRSASTTRPVAGAVVELASLEAKTLPRSAGTNDEGRVEFTRLDAGRYRAIVRAQGFAEARADSLILAAETGLVAQSIMLVPGAPLTGRVVDATGRALAGAQVCVSPPGVPSYASGSFRPSPILSDPLCAKSGGDGTAVLASLPYGSYKVSVRADGHAPIDGEMTQLTASSNLQTWVLSPAGAIAGRLADAADRGVAGATVRLKDRLRGKSVEGTTDGSGSFRLDGLPPGIWRVEIEPAEHLSVLRDTVVVEPNETTSLGTLRARAAAALDGRTVGADGAAAAGAEIRVQESEGAKRVLRTTTSDDKGNFHVGGLPKDAAVDLVVRPKQGTARAFRALTLPVQNGTFPLDAAVRLKGTVTIEDGTIPPGTQVSVFPKQGHPSFEANAGLARVGPVDPGSGAFSVENVPAGGEVEVRVFAPGLPWAATTVNAAAGADAGPVQIQIHRSEPVVHGEVKNRDGRPVAGARIGATTTDDAGRFVLENVAPGQGKYVVMHPDYAPLAHEFRPGAEAETVLVLEEGGAVEGALTDGRGRPVVGVHVSAEWPGAGAITGVGGRFRLEHVPTGETSVQRQGVGVSGDFERRKLTIEAGETKQVNFQIGRSILEGGLIRSGEPLSGATLSVQQPPAPKRTARLEDSLYQSTTSDEEGGWRLAGLSPGPATMTVNYGKQSLIFPVEIPEGPAARLELDVPRRVLKGVVLDSTGKPLTNACVASEIKLSGSSPVASDTNGEEGAAQSYTRTTTDADGRFLLFQDEDAPNSVTVCSCGIGCQEVAVDAAGDDEPVTLWFSPKVQDPKTPQPKDE